MFDVWQVLNVMSYDSSRKIEPSFDKVLFEIKQPSHRVLFDVSFVLHCFHGADSVRYEWNNHWVAVDSTATTH